MENEDEGSLLDQIVEQQEMDLQQAQISEDQIRQLQVEEKLKRNQLKQILRNIGMMRTRLTSKEKRIIKESKRFKRLKPQIERINTALNANKLRNFSKMMSATPLLAYIGIFMLFVFLIIAVFAVIESIMPWLFGGSNNDNGGNAAFGVTGNDFYGVRMVYQDDDKANKQIVEDYVNFVENGILKAQQTTSINAGGTDYNVELNITHITIPEGYDYSKFNEETFKTDYPQLSANVLNIAKETFKVDNINSDVKEYDGTSIIDCVSGIKYFGIGNLDVVAPMVAEEIIVPSAIKVKDSEGNEISVEESTLTSIEDAIETLLVDNYKLTPAYSVRTQKLFVKDYILDSADKMVSGVTSEKYVQMIFMPNKNVTFTSLSFAVGNADLTNFKMFIDGKEIKHDGNNLGTAENQSYIYSSGAINISAGEFEDINTEDKTALSEGLSLFEISKLATFDKYLSANTETGVLELKQNGVIVEMSNEEAFLVIEYESKWTANN